MLFGYHTNMFLILCKSSHECLVNSSSYHTYILFVLDSLFYDNTYSPWLVTTYNCTFFTIWTYHWWFEYPFALMPMWEWAHCNSQYSSIYYHNYLFWRVEHMYKKRFPTFFLARLDDKSIFLSLEMVIKP